MFIPFLLLLLLLIFGFFFFLQYFSKKENIHIVGLAGSLREGSRTKKAVEIALKGSEHLRCKVTMLNLADFNLPFRDGMDHETKLKPVPENVVKFRQAIKGNF